MKYYPKEVYYEVREGFVYIVLDYGDSKVEHKIAAEQGVQRIGLLGRLMGAIRQPLTQAARSFHARRKGS